MHEIAEQISLAIGRSVRYIPISREDRRQALVAAGTPSFFADALDVQAGERLKGIEAIVHPETHAALGISPTTIRRVCTSQRRRISRGVGLRRPRLKRHASSLSVEPVWKSVRFR